MKKTNKKGFTIVELVIVIAVIAILSAVLIPTFGTVISDANEVAAQSTAKDAYTAFVQECVDSDDTAPNADSLDKDLYIVVDTYVFAIVNGELIEGALDTTTTPAKPTIDDNETVLYTATNGAKVYLKSVVDGE